MEEHFLVSNSEMAFFVLIGVLSGFPAATYRHVRLAANPCAALIRTKISHF